MIRDTLDVVVTEVEDNSTLRVLEVGGDIAKGIMAEVYQRQVLHPEYIRGDA